jgi:hypothetical protein
MKAGACIKCGAKGHKAAECRTCWRAQVTGELRTVVQYSNSSTRTWHAPPSRALTLQLLQHTPYQHLVSLQDQQQLASHNLIWR